VKIVSSTDIRDRSLELYSSTSPFRKASLGMAFALRIALSFYFNFAPLTSLYLFFESQVSPELWYAMLYFINFQI
jgi:hypothetical protein